MRHIIWIFASVLAIYRRTDRFEVAQKAELLLLADEIPAGGVAAKRRNPEFVLRAMRVLEEPALPAGRLDVGLCHPPDYSVTWPIRPLIALAKNGLCTHTAVS